MILLIHSLNELAHLISNGATGLLLLVAYPIRVVQKSWKCIPLSRFERFPGRFDMKPLIIFFNTKWEVGWHTPEIFMVIMQRPHKKKCSHNHHHQKESLQTWTLEQEKRKGPFTNRWLCFDPLPLRGHFSLKMVM